MSSENLTALATIVIAVATVAYMAISIFQGRMMLKSFRLNALLALRDIITLKGSDAGSGFMAFMFLRLYQQIFPKDYVNSRYWNFSSLNDLERAQFRDRR